MVDQIPQALVELHNSGKPREVAQGYLDHFRSDLERALNYDQITAPRGGIMTMDSFAASVNLEVSTNERLVEAMMGDPASFMKSVMLAAQCKLLVGSAYDLFYLIPRWNGKKRRMEVTPLIGYKGLSDMAQRHPRVHKVDAILIYEGEHFDYDAGAGKMSHKVNLMGERSEEKMIGGYARVVITEPTSTHPVLDDPVIHLMNRDQLMAIRDRSDSYQQAEKPSKYGDGKPRKNSSWHTDPLPMHRKTLLRAVLNGGSVPKDMGVGAAIHAEDQSTITIEPKQKVQGESMQDSIRQQLGIEPTPEPFANEDVAISAIEQCEDAEALAALRPQIEASEFEGDAVNKAYAEREFVLMPEDPDA